MAERKRKNDKETGDVQPTLKEIYNLRKAEEKLKTLNDRMQHIFNTLDNSFWGVDMVDFKMLYASLANEKIYGYTIGEFYQNPGLWYHVIIPEDKHIGKWVISEIRKGLPLTVEYRIRHKNGSVRWIEVKQTPTLDEHGKLLVVDGITIDISERKQAEEKMKESQRQLLEAQKIARIGDYTYDFGTGIWKCSSVLDEITGLGPEAILIFDNWIALISPDAKNEITDKIFPLIQEGTIPSGHYLDCKINRANDGEERWVSIVGEMECDENGKPLRLKGTVQDITERKRTEDEIRLLNESLEHKVEDRTVELKQLNRELEAFNYTVSHDLQNPLRSLAGFSKLLMNDYEHKLDDDGKEYLKTIEASAKRMSTLVRDLLSFAQLGKIAVAKVNVDMKKVAEAAIDEINSSNYNPKTEIVVHELKPAFCDAGLIRQVWDNLIGNAVKYSSKKGKPKVEVGMLQTNDEEVYYVKDNGAGFEMKNADKLFKVFERLHNKHEFEGTGIGLSTVERIIVKQGGRIWAEGKVDEGAIFYFTLPAKIAES